MALEVKQKASVCWFDVDFGLNLSRFIEQLCPKKRKNSVTLDLHSELDGRMAIVKSHFSDFLNILGLSLIGFGGPDFVCDLHT